MAKDSIHSEFRARLVLSVRAPLGNHASAVQRQELVSQLAERHSNGCLNEWIIEAMLDRIANEKMAGIGVGRGKGIVHSGEAAFPVPEESRIKPALRSQEAYAGPTQSVEPAPAAQRRALPAGLNSIMG